MENLKHLISQNIASLRRAAGMTQITLAEKLHYSDKAISKWERGESLPDIAVLKEIADLFGVTVDFLLFEHTDDKLPEPEVMPDEIAAARRKNHVTIALLATAAVWLVATILFAVLYLIGIKLRLWTIFIYAVPISCIVALVFNSIWGRNKKWNYLIVSLLMWGILFSLYILFLEENIALIFTIGIPGQVIILISTQLQQTKRMIQNYFPPKGKK
ncbi:MAG TPA: helix-turn-helix transcriptional regulator [Oscillospiraceae bacterium]|nr:helix-turn-helix transcriptional regulator [Oscillospiraceae bacterium]HPS33820.1 helix-turn-helix transcriptional regulator [Oscillospiraceae bacterium]